MTRILIPHFGSVLAHILYDFVEFKRACGYKYNGEVKVLQQLDKSLFCRDAASGIDVETALSEWLKKRDCESFKTFSIRNSVYRQLFEYVSERACITIPRPVFISEKPHGSGFVPFIFSHEQIKAFMTAIDEDNYANPTFHRCAPLLFRLLYGTGLRINEALSLNISDVSPGCEMILIRDGKNDNSRLVPLSPSLSKHMKEYLNAVDYSDNEPLFQTMFHTAVKSNSAYDWFRRILWRSGIPHQGRGKGPRMHDLRHTFAVHSLQRAVDNGTDINAFLPILCAYLGHRRISATERYLRLTNEVFPEIIDDANEIMNSIVPEVNDYED